MNTIVSLLSSLLFYVLPVILGTPFTLLLNKRRLDIYSPFIAFSLGSLIIFILYILNAPALLIPAVLLSTIAFSAIVIFLGIERLEFTKYRVLIILSLGILSLISYGVWRCYSPLSATLNWDLYHQQTLANQINKGGFSILTTELSDTFQFAGYTTLFHTLLSSSERLLRPEILSYWWFLEFFHLCFTIYASFLVGFSFSKSKMCGLVSAVFGAFVFEANGAYTSLFLIPQNLSATVGVVFLSYVYRERTDNNKIFSLTYPFILLFIVLNHFVIGAYIFGLYLLLTVFLVLNKMSKLQSILFTLVLLVLIVLPFISSYVDLSWLNRGEAQFFNYSLDRKDMYTKIFYGWSLYILVPLGILSVILIKNRSLKVLILLCAVGLSLLVSPVPYSTKLYSVSRYFIHTLMALGFWFVIRRSNTRIKTISLVLLTITFVPIYIANIVTYKQVPYYKDISTHVSPNEVEAAGFLARNYADKDTLLVSDPATMHILEGLSGVNTPGGAYTNERTRQILSDIYFTRDSENMAYNIRSIRDELDNKQPSIYLLVVGGRFAAWEEASDTQKMGIQWNVWEPYDLKPVDWAPYGFIDFVANYSKFPQVYRNQGIIIFEVQDNADIFE